MMSSVTWGKLSFGFKVYIEKASKTNKGDADYLSGSFFFRTKLFNQLRERMDLSEHLIMPKFILSYSVEDHHATGT